MTDDPNLVDPTQPFVISPEVDERNRRGQEVRRLRREISDQLTDMTERLLREHPDQHSVIAQILEGESYRINSIREQKIRHEREARRAQENVNESNRGTEKQLSNGVQGVPGEQHASGGGPKKT